MWDELCCVVVVFHTPTITTTFQSLKHQTTKIRKNLKTLTPQGFAGIRYTNPTNPQQRMEAMQRVSVNGGWVDFREPEDVPERLRRRVTTMAGKAANIANRMNAEGLDESETLSIEEDDLRFLLEFNDAVAICLVMGWSWTEIPVTSDGLLDLPASAYDHVVRHGQAQVSRLLPNFGVDPDPKVTTDNSSESATL